MAEANHLTPFVGIPAELRDGFEVHTAALRHGLDVALYPRQVMIAREPTSGKELSFIHGVPGSAQLGPVTYAQDKRMRRALMESAQLPIPRGVTFSVGRGVDAAKAFADRIGYPVVVKPAVGDNAIEIFADIQNVQEFDAAIAKLRVPPTERETFTRAAYGLTELREPGEEDGRMVVPPGYRFLVEEHVHGTYLRTLVIRSTVHSAMLAVGSPGLEKTEEGSEVLDDVHPSLLQLAVRALAAVPGIPVAAVDLVVEDHRRAAEHQEVSIVEFSERPGLGMQAAISQEWSSEMGNRLVRDHAERSEVPVLDPDDEVSVHWSAEAIPDPDGALEGIMEFAGKTGLQLVLEPVDRVEGRIEGTICGATGDIASLSEALLAGDLAGHRAMFAETRHA